MFNPETDTKAKISNVQAELKHFNNAGCIFDLAAKAAVEANTAEDGTIDKAKATAALEAEFAKHDYKIFVDDIKLEAETAAVPVKVTASGAVIKVSGDAKVGSTLTVGYVYEGNTTDASTIQWQKFVDGAWNDIEGETGKSYKVKEEDDNAYIRAVISTKNAEGESWKTVITPPTYIGVLELFVATNGDDEKGDGSIEKPFATVGAARDVLRGMIADELLPLGEVYVSIRGGEYPVSASTTFSAADSAPDGTTIVYRSYHGETASFTGSKTVSNSKVTKITEADVDRFGNKIFDRVTDPMAQANLYKIDLTDFAPDITPLTEWGWSDPNSKDGTWDNAYAPSELFVDGHLLSWAKWPNEEDNAMVDIGDVIKTSDNFKNEPSTFMYQDDNDETVNWNGDYIEDQMLIWGYMGSHWCANSYMVGDFDPANKTISTKFGTYTKPTASYQIYFFNFFEAIDMPGESFIDRETNIAYFYAPNTITGANEVRLSTYTGTMFNFSGASNIKLEGIEMKYTKGQPLSVSSTEKFDVENCLFAHGSKGASLSGTNITFRNNIVTQNGYGGISIEGGDRATLTPSNDIVENNVFTYNGRTKRTYAPAINMSGVGVKIKGNEMAYNPHEVVTFGGNDHEIYENYIHHACQETGDMGAIYWGRDPSVLGVKIHDNFFWRMSNVYNTGWSQSIFADDGNYGAEVYNNIFYQGTLTTERGGQDGRSYAFKKNGGQHFKLTNNIFVDMPASAYFQSWVGTGFTSPMQGQYITYNNNARPTSTANGYDKAVFDVSANDTADVTVNKEYNVNYNLGEAKINASNNAVVKLNVDAGEHSPAITTTTKVPAGNAVMEIPEGIVLDSNVITNLHSAGDATGKLPNNIAATAGLIAGLGDGTFAPLANATRAQSASLISRLLK